MHVRAAQGALCPEDGVVERPVALEAVCGVGHNHRLCVHEVSIACAGHRCILARGALGQEVLHALPVNAQVMRAVAATRVSGSASIAHRWFASSYLTLLFARLIRLAQIVRVSHAHQLRVQFGPQHLRLHHDGGEAHSRV